MEPAAAQALHAVNWLVWIPVLPLIGFLFNGLGWIILRQRLTRSVVNLVAVGLVFASFALSVQGFLLLRELPEGAFLGQTVFPWIQVGDFTANFGLLFDRLSCVMCLVVTGVGGLIHLYSVGYMGHDPAYARYFSYLNLFTFAMLTLVMADNLVLMFVGWEGVGLCSYLLIGFWYEDPEKAAAGKKAFIVNRIGDFGFLIGIFTIVWLMQTVDFHQMQAWTASPGHRFLLEHQTLLGIAVPTFICLALFVGAIGKSAQIPLYVWLPDAMAGPTPVSALIHAATMVTAGVYMIGRLNFLYLFSETALLVVALVGVATALYSATIGFTQNDIKKVLAYSTVSQLGFMFTAMGAAAFSAGIFHLVTHAFFKALLFLGAGSVIHGLSGEQDLRRMGGLRKKMPITAWTMVMAWLAICGVFPFAGFVSKDEILWRALNGPFGYGKLIYIIGFLAAVGTAIYMTRLIMLAFFTESRLDPEVEHHAHESPWTMWVPLAILAVLSVVGGFLNWPLILPGGHAAFEHWLEPVMALPPEAEMTTLGVESTHSMEIFLMVFSVAAAVAAIIMVGVIYARRRELTDRIAAALGPLYRASFNKYWVDEIYDALVVEPCKWISYFILFRFADAGLVDGLANGLGGLTRALGMGLRRIQTGLVRNYAFMFLIGVLGILAYFYWSR
ncbi:MAG: NADH-quinone oxidoreductase subunit L [Deltaproteobacteria bacterium RBG_13_61_14]|nr:MAG: NADH-quinone oxidoreductase subunit L [Deltaproteobacteria bacterium RBG_13_61_14]